MKHSALRRAIEQDNLHAVMVALDHGANIEEADMHGDAGLPLRIACYRGNAEIVQELIARGADIHAPNAQGPGGPIRSAARGKHTHIIHLLAAFGANIPDDVALPVAEQGERRRRSDRRRRNMGPPSGLRERRAHQERRVTSVQEVVLDEVQWERYFSQSQIEALRQAEPALVEDVSMILSRARD